MEILGRSGAAARVGWPGRGALLELRAPSGGEGGWCRPDTRRDGFVWLGLSNIPDAVQALEAVRAAALPGANVALQGQIEGDTGTVGVVGHFEDPDGYMLEALQVPLGNPGAPRGLEEPGEARGPAPAPLAAPRPVLGQLKVNTRSVDRTLAFYRDGLGMTLLSEVKLSRFGLSLYFLASTDLRPPGWPEELDSEANRSWLWRADFPQLEVQHWWGFEEDKPLRLPGEGAQLGFLSLDFTCADAAATAQRLLDAGARLAEPLEGDRHTAKSCVVLDPDGRRVRLLEEQAPPDSAAPAEEAVTAATASGL